MIDPVDLQLAEPKEIIPGYIFYLKEGNEFRRCCIPEEELKSPERAQFLRLQTREYLKEKRLYRRTNRPGMGFE